MPTHPLRVDVWRRFQSTMKSVAPTVVNERCGSALSATLARAGFENKLATVFEFSVQLAGETEEDVSLDAPMVSQVPWRVLDHADADAPKVLGAPRSACHACFAFVFNSRPMTSQLFQMECQWAVKLRASTKQKRTLALAISLGQV